MEYLYTEVLGMTVMQQDNLTEWAEKIKDAMKQHLHQIPYGNLRAEFSGWTEESGRVENLAIVYEVPGGSTNQINITFHESAGKFSYIDIDSHDEVFTDSIDDVITFITKLVLTIPTIRVERLQEDIDRWYAMGMCQKDLFQKMTKLLQIEDLRGGTITMHEMKAGIAYILARTKT